MRVLATFRVANALPRDQEATEQERTCGITREEAAAGDLAGLPVLFDWDTSFRVGSVIASQVCPATGRWTVQVCLEVDDRAGNGDDAEALVRAAPCLSPAVKLAAGSRLPLVKAIPYFSLCRSSVFAGAVLSKLRRQHDFFTGAGPV